MLGREPCILSFYISEARHISGRGSTSFDVEAFLRGICMMLLFLAEHLLRGSLF